MVPIYFCKAKYGTSVLYGATFGSRIYQKSERTNPELKSLWTKSLLVILKPKVGL